jgi:hypothetical protein
MLRLCTDFNARTENGDCWNLIHQGLAVDDSLMKNGDRVILFQDEDDFEVEATIYFRFVGELKRDSWVAVPDWSTKRKIARPVHG